MTTEMVDPETCEETPGKAVGSGSYLALSQHTRLSVLDLKPTIPEGFDSPTALPRTEDQRRQWQEANRSWWESNPMRYDFSTRIEAPEFSKEFFKEIDDRFYSDVKTFMPWRAVPFDAVLDFDSLADKDVLEIGVGNGSHAQLISSHSRSFTGIDLTDYAIRSTRRRLQLVHGDKTNALAGLRLMRMDAECMDFADESFDLVWSWGVIHHSANTRKILEEIHRVLRPGGMAITMVYHRTFWNHYIFAGLFSGIFQRTLFSTFSIHQTRQRLIDGAIARYYSVREWRDLVADLFAIEANKIYGSKSELIPLPNGRLKAGLKFITPNVLGRLLTNRCRLGMFLVTTLRKPQAQLR
jgi:SAM-dependent methyltransferase